MHVANRKIFSIWVVCVAKWKARVEQKALPTRYCYISRTSQISDKNTGQVTQRIRRPVVAVPAADN
jgi:hypothetical protein